MQWSQFMFKNKKERKEQSSKWVYAASETSFIIHFSEHIQFLDFKKSLSFHKFIINESLDLSKHCVNTVVNRYESMISTEKPLWAGMG